MGFFNRNKQGSAVPETAPTKTPAKLPGSNAGKQGADTSVYSETTKSQKSGEAYHPDDEAIAEDDEDIDEEEVHRATEWDEGGASHCGYSEGVHETLMHVGGSVHGVVGDPPSGIEQKMNTVANWFQEMSYAIRDFWRGQSNMSEDLQDVMNSVMESDSQDEADNDKTDSNGNVVATQS